MKHVRIGFADFETMWGPEPSPFQFFLNLLDEFDVTVTQDSPDLLICSWPGNNHLKYSCPKLFYSGEWREPDFQMYQWCMTHSYCDDPRHYRLPIYLLFGDAYQLLRPKPLIEQIWDRKFCCTAFGKRVPHAQSPREDFFQRLCQYKQVDSFGLHFNNMGRQIPLSGKIVCCQNYKFSLAFENHSTPGWTTEKIFMPMLANSIPIYWGNPEIGREFNTRSFVNCHEYPNFDAIIERVKELDQKKEEYAKMLAEPWYLNNKVNRFANRENIRAFFRKVLDGVKG